MSFVPLNSELHQGKRWLRHSSFEFAKHDNVTPIFANELPDAIHTLPVAFVRHEDQFVLVAVMGLRPQENLLVASNGQWQAGGYKPVNYRTRPFLLLEVPDDKEKQVLCLEEGNLTEGDIGEELFNEEGKVTEIVGEIFNLLTHYNKTRFLTQGICDALEKLGLIIPWEMTINDGETEQPFTGLYRVDETALNNLSDENFLALREIAAFPVIYSQLLSMNNMSNLSDLLIKRINATTVSTKSENRGGTFNFAGL